MSKLANKLLSTVSTSAKDPYFKNVALLLHGDGTNGGQNNTFIDGSTNNYTITRNGSPTQGSFNPYGTLWSNHFDGSGDYLTAPANAAFQFGTGDFTVEAWIYPTASGSNNQYFITMRAANGGASGTWGLGQESDKFVFDEVVVGATTAIEGTSVPVLNAWTHVAVTRSGTAIRLFVNGALETSATSNTNFSASVYPLYIGYDTGSLYTRGYLSNIRIVKGTAVYTAAFTPPTSPLTAISNTSFLTCQSNRFIDNSTNNLAITRNGDVAVTNFAPFAPTSVYTTAQGASGYFSSTSYLQITGPASGTGTWTVEGWLYPTNFAATNNAIFSQGDADTLANWLLWVTSGGSIVLYSNGNIAASASGVIKINTWQHIALVSSSSNVTIYVDGVSVATGSYAGKTFNDSPFQINRGYGGVAAGNNCYISDARLVVGTAVYTAAFMPPTSPLTAITNTQLLCNFKNAAIFDSAAKNDLETVGNAQIDTAIKKFGTGSLKFDGNGDYLALPPTPTLEPSSGNLTWEMWVNTSSSTQNATLYVRSANSPSVGTWSLMCNLASATAGDVGLFLGDYSAATPLLQTSGVNIRDSNWHHIAVVRNGSSWALYVDGTSRATNTWAGTISALANVPAIGRDQSVYGPRDYLGYIDDFRITNGVARYTTNFTPPRRAFQDN